MDPVNIILCGLPGCGKTSIGKILAEKMGRPFLDTDVVLEQLYIVLTEQQLSCRQIAAKEGMQFFNELEHNILSLLVKDECKGHIIATGGGILSHPGNIHLIQKLGNVVYIKASSQEILKRLLTKGMPTYLNSEDPEGSFSALAMKRTPLYEQVCSTTVDISGCGLDAAYELVRSKCSKVCEI